MWSRAYVESFERQSNATPQGVEWDLNHRHIVNFHASNEVEPTMEHMMWLGTTLREIYSVKLAWQFPDRRCEVEFCVPDDAQYLGQYLISLLQKK